MNVPSKNAHDERVEGGPSRPDELRPGTPLRTRRVPGWAALSRALGRAEGTRTVVVLHDGSGQVGNNVTTLGYRVVRSGTGTPADAGGAQSTPGSGAADCVLCPSLEPGNSEARRAQLREMGALSRRWIVVGCLRRSRTSRLIRTVARLFGFAPSGERCGLTRRQADDEFTDAGLEIISIRPNRPIFANGWVILAETHGDMRELVQTEARASGFPDLEIGERLGAGRRSEVYGGRLRGRDVIVKIYRRTAIERHRRKLGMPIARFEYERNQTLFRTEGVGCYIAEPLGCVVTDKVQFMIQERLRGTLYYYHAVRHGTPRGVREHLERMVAACHQAGIFDLDLHALNVFVERNPDGELTPRLFDFNQIPAALANRNPLSIAALHLGLVNLRSRDKHKLARLDDFRRIERRLIDRYFLQEINPAGPAP